MREHKALIAHFSGTPAPRAFEVYYPDDLARVIAGGALTGLSCSVVKPGDNFDHDRGPRNAYGSIGVIIDLMTSESLRAVHVGDGGSFIENGVRVFDEGPIDLALLERSLNGRAETNEWGIRDYLTRGIFVAEPIEFSTASGEIVRTDVASVSKSFPDHPLYTFRDGEVVKILADGSVEAVSLTELYPE
ncbi:hypothetical protein [Bradyrhizobium diazoefficiens]|uniref:hypothetical protein n=1 Tax=Bradyrhizobium diazoefficiens TaxID=1355477 RepID=UPI001B75D7AD|nr:hypothetical protein [Bradyrhizobium japonicum]